ncbi:MAG: GNAT family N-acetyltransferase [Actinomycetes bacterium]
MPLSIRPGNVGDAETFTRLANDHHEAFTGEPLWSLEEMRAVLVTATADPTRDDRYVMRDGETIAGFHTRCYEPFDVGRIDLAIPLQTDRTQIVAILVDSALRVLKARPRILPDAVAQATVPSEDQEILDVMYDRAFLRTGRLALLEIPVDKVTGPPLPEDLRIETFDVAQHVDDGFSMLDQSFPTAGSNWYIVRDDFEHMMRNDPTALRGLSLMAYRGSEPVGISVNFVDTMRPFAGHIGMLGVARSARRRGVGRALFFESLARFQARGWSHARLTTITPASGVGGEDAGGFFRSVGMTTVYDHDIVARPLFDRR